MFRPAGTLFMLLCSMSACNGTSGATCSRDDECPSNFCKANGTCGDAEVDAGAGDDAPPSSLCMPNGDGAISRAELPLVAGNRANFRVATDPTWDTAGTGSGPGGGRHWILTATLANDADRTIELLDPTAAWWAPMFPSATYAAPLAADSDLLGVFRVDEAAVTLLGVVSPAAGTFRTELEYAPPAMILALPMTEYGMWMSTSTVSGTAQGAIVAYTERYTTRADRKGIMTTPYGDFPVVRVTTDLTRSSLGSTILTKRTFAWLAECFGAVANAQSQDFESQVEFIDPAEVRRLIP